MSDISDIFNHWIEACVCLCMKQAAHVKLSDAVSDRFRPFSNTVFI